MARLIFQHYQRSRTNAMCNQFELFEAPLENPEVCAEIMNTSSDFIPLTLLGRCLKRKLFQVEFCQCSNTWLNNRQVYNSKLYLQQNLTQISSVLAHSTGDLITFRGVHPAVEKSCECPNIYSINNCSEFVNYCESQPCMNGGTCEATDGGYTCVCTANFAGKY